MEPKETDLMNTEEGMAMDKAMDAVEDAKEVESEPSGGVSFKDITEMVDSIEKIGQSVEMQRQMADANERMASMCFQMGISKNDQDFLKAKFKKNDVPDDKFAEIIKDKDKLNAEYFTREDGSVITIDKAICEQVSMTEFDLKVDFVETLRTFYGMEADAQKSIDEINQSIEEFKFGEISELSSTIANNFKQSLKDRMDETEKIEDEKEKKRRMKLINRMMSAYTFDEYIKVLEKYPSIVKNTISELKKPEMIKNTGARYNQKRQRQGCATSLIAIVRDDVENSLERQYMAPGDYVEGYENLFAYFILRFFSKEDWSSKDSFTKEMHNATTIILTTLMAGQLDKDFREEVISNINKIWALFKVAM